MRSLSCCILLAAAAQGSSIRERAFIPPVRAPPVRAPPRVGEVSNSPYRPNNARPVGVGDVGDGALTGIAGAGRGTAPESTTPFRSEEGFYARNKELIDKALESVEQVFDLLSNIVDLAGGDDEDEDDSSSSTPPFPKPIQVSSISDGATNSTANYILNQNNVTYTFTSDPRLISLDVVAEMSGPTPNRLSFQQDLFTAEEYGMFVDSPVCFYANIEQMYSQAPRRKLSQHQHPMPHLQPPAQPPRQPTSHPMKKQPAASTSASVQQSAQPSRAHLNGRLPKRAPFPPSGPTSYPNNCGVRTSPHPQPSRAK